MLSDANQRQRATEPNHSFIVQAPAGSGKTEILIQRYLRLLATVQAPEEIIALTFTRKAANEMRERVLQALQKAANAAPPTSEHQRQTFAYATKALERDQAFNWQLLQHPSRMRIFTIDALCQQLTQSIPLTEKHIPFAKISEQSSLHYLTAAQACLTYAIQDKNYAESIKTILRHVDNRQDNLLSLLSDLLAKRDQWLLPLHQARLQDKHLFEQALVWIEQHELAFFRQSVPKDYQETLTELAREVATIEANKNSPRYLLQEWQCFEEINSALGSSLASLLLTSQNTLRKTFDHHVGLKRGVCDDKTYQQIKTASSSLLANLSEIPDFVEALLRIRKLPSPEYDPQQWEVLQALFHLLPLLTAHLHLVFSEHNEVDFTAVGQQALQALGDEESPTDLALYLDYRIHHLLIDEFQDTSIQQFQLLTKLVQGWQENEGKTIFVVGDPMQSIYRFRSAEVGLFLRAQKEGIGPVKLTPLELSCNFRSTPTIVDWVNQQFQGIFPRIDDIESGAVSFHPSQTIQSSASESYVKAFQFENTLQEAQALLQLVQEELQSNKSETIAILVRSRNQLTEIIRLLREEKIPFQGVEIDPLAGLPHINDAWSLTQALLMPANRLAWLSFLRSPWCGLSLADLHCIANVAKNQSIYFALSKLEQLSTLSNEGALRARFIYHVMQEALACRHQQSLSEWIGATLKKLHQEQILGEEEQTDLEQYWCLLDKFDNGGQITDVSFFKQELNKLYSKQAKPSRLQIMTIHKSKGLEFDCVILPGLSTKPPAADRPLLRWLKLPTQHHELFLLSPLKAAHQESCPLYDYLGKLDAQKNDYELQRLLYVAVTRARKRLYLFDHSEAKKAKTFRYLLQQQPFITRAAEEEVATKAQKLPELYRLPIEFYQTPPPISAPAQNQLTMTAHNHTSRLLGIVTHELLQWICDNHPSSVEEVPLEMANNHLRTLGFTNDQLHAAQQRIKIQLKQLFADPKGQWIIKAHAQEQNEYELLVRAQGEVATKIIDRTFCEKGTRWIIDFKTGRDESNDQTYHRKQVTQYAGYLSTRFPEPIRCGLYYLANNHWVQWDYESSYGNIVAFEQ